MPLDYTLTQARSTAQPAPARVDPCADPAPPCLVCGGLKCLCRPRFFPGQLLSDEDLNRLQQYVIDKNRLHNRYLVGWGVACGLEVVCSSCDAGQVTVRSGYALSPCGDDIVVCGDQSVDVCALIQACRPVNPNVCETPYGQAPTSCTQGTERWVLGVCYDERPTRPINALTSAADSVATTGCRCGGSAGCGCGTKSGSGCSCGGATASSGAGTGCGCGAKSSAYQPASQRRKVLAQCEPTQVCEGFRFTAWKAPAELKGLSSFGNDNQAGNAVGGDLMIAWLYANRARFGPLLERTLCCVLQAMDLRATLAEGKQVNAAGAVSAYRDYAQALNEFASVFSLHHCSFVGAVGQQYESATSWSSTRTNGVLNTADQAELSTRYAALDTSWMQIVTECFCSALLPACPPSATNNCVPLAVITVNTGTGFSTTSRIAAAGGCRVVDICNWQERKLLITWPTITYWLSWLPWQNLRAVIARICCGSGRQGSAYTLMMLMLGIAASAAKSSSTNSTSTNTTSTFTPAANSFSTVATAEGATGGSLRADSAAPASNALSGAANNALQSTSASASASTPAPGSFEAAMQAPNLLLHMLGDFDAAGLGAESQPEWAALAARALNGRAFAPLAGDPALRQVDLGDLGGKLGVDTLRKQVAELQKTVAQQNEILHALQIVNRSGDAQSPAGVG